MTLDNDDIIRKHAMAVTNLLLGNRKMKAGVAICGGEPLDMDGHIQIAQMAKMSDTDVVHLGFGTRANHSYGMTGISVILVRESKCFVQTGCQLWLGEIGNRAVILPRPESRGHFRLSPREIIHIDGKPAENAYEGIRRAEAWVERRVRSNAAMPVNAEFVDVPVAA